MLDKLAVKQRVEEIQRRRSLLVDYKEMDFEEFSSNIKHYELAIRHLQVAIEACLDVAKMLISANGFDRPLDLRESFGVLAKKGVIKPDLAKRLTKAVGLRNIVVHSYPETDLNYIYEAIKNDLSDFDAFVESIENYLSSH